VRFAETAVGFGAAARLAVAVSPILDARDHAGDVGTEATVVFSVDASDHAGAAQPSKRIRRTGRQFGPHSLRAMLPTSRRVAWLCLLRMDTTQRRYRPETAGRGSTMIVQTLTGQITGAQIEADTKSQYCNYHLSLKRMQ
jgi:hypothetical protein